MLKFLHNIQWNRVLYLSLFFLGVIAVVIVMSLVNRKDDQQVCREININSRLISYNVFKPSLDSFKIRQS